MFLHFPNLNTLQLALSSGAVPAPVAAAPVAARFAEGGDVWVQPTGELPDAAKRKLHQLGVTAPRSAKAEGTQQFAAWHQLLPVVRDGQSPDIGDKTPVMFELADAQQLPEIVGEMLRLGNDRQAFAYVAGRSGDLPHALLRVMGPPYYSLLRALDHHGANGTAHAAPVAYLEQSPRVWVQLGYRHASTAKLQPPPGQLLFIRPPREWRFVAETPLVDIYQTLDVELPQQPASYQPHELSTRLRVSLRLATGSTSESAELWVVRQRAIEQLERLVCDADDRLLARLAFAAVENESGPLVVLRVRPAKEPPPVLVLDAVAHRSYLKLPNLFVPVGRRLHPPLRRDIVAKLLTPKKNDIVWLTPGEAGTFTPESLPDSAFRPLTDWVDYIVDRDTAALDAWVASHRFDFEPFICRDEEADKPRKPPREAHPPRPKNDALDTPSTSTAKPKKAADESGAAQAHAEVLKMLAESAQPTQASKLQQRLRDLEKSFQDSPAPLDAPERAAQWRELAVVNAALKHRHDATVCWGNALWESPQLTADQVRGWLTCEQQAAGRDGLRPRDLDRLADNKLAQPSEASLIAALLAWASVAHDEAVAEVLRARLPVISQYLARQEAFLPIRAAWLAWLGLVRLADRDILALARARDRLLQRLFQHGLLAEFDLPTFLRTGGGVESHRLQAARDQMLTLREKVSRWIVEPPHGPVAQTRSYADLMFACALARLGETTASEVLFREAAQRLERDPLHAWVRDAFAFRLEQLRHGDKTPRALDAKLLERLDSLPKLERYKLDRLRQHSHFLEPHERVDPYRRWHGRHADDLARELAELFDINERDKLERRLAELWKRTARDKDRSEQPRVLATALKLAPRLGEAFAGEMLGRLDAVLTQSSDVVERALLLERGLHVAAHFDQVETVHACVRQLEGSLDDIVATYLTLQTKYNPENKERLDTIDALFSQSLLGLRKLGMRDEMGRLFTRVALAVKQRADQHAGRKPKSKSPAQGRDRELNLLLVAVGGWYYFGQIAEADAVADEVRVVLLQGNLPPVEQKQLACAYIQAVAQAPIEKALARIGELFASGDGKPRNLDAIKDAMTTSTHYSLSQLDVVEAAVRALVSDDFAMSDQTRRWLDEDEFLVRRRIHRDVREALAVAGM